MQRLGALMLSLVACGPSVGVGHDEDLGGSSTTEAEPSPIGATTTQPPLPRPTGSTGEDDFDDGVTFIVTTDGGTIRDPCDAWAQDCPKGEKCVPRASDGGPDVDMMYCTSIPADPVPLGEACTVEGYPTSGIDDCELGALCWDVDPDELSGTCAPLCGATPKAPQCPEDHACLIDNGGVLSICLPACDLAAANPDKSCAIGTVCSPASPHSSADEQTVGVCRVLSE